MRARMAHGRPGFTLLEIIVVVVVIGVLAAVVVPQFSRANVDSHGARLANDLRTIGDAFILNHATTGTWRNDSGAFGVTPEERFPELRNPDIFAVGAGAAGGSYDWNGPPHADINVSCTWPSGRTSTIDAIVAEADRIADDGNPATGNMRFWLGANYARILD